MNAIRFPLDIKEPKVCLHAVKINHNHQKVLIRLLYEDVQDVLSLIRKEVP